MLFLVVSFIEITSYSFGGILTYLSEKSRFFEKALLLVNKLYAKLNNGNFWFTDRIPIETTGECYEVFGDFCYISKFF